MSGAYRRRRWVLPETLPRDDGGVVRRSQPRAEEAPPRMSQSCSEVLARFREYRVADIIVHRRVLRGSAEWAHANAVAFSGGGGDGNQYYNLTVTMELVHEQFVNGGRVMASRLGGFVMLTKMPGVGLVIAEASEEAHRTGGGAYTETMLDLGAPPTAPAVTFLGLAERVYADMGAGDFFGYDPLSNNCQALVLALARAAGYREQMMMELMAFVGRAPQPQQQRRAAAVHRGSSSRFLKRRVRRHHHHDVMPRHYHHHHKGRADRLPQYSRYHHMGAHSAHYFTPHQLAAGGAHPNFRAAANWGPSARAAPMRHEPASDETPMSEYPWFDGTLQASRRRM